jgi:hypothetical protein
MAKWLKEIIVRTYLLYSANVVQSFQPPHLMTQHKIQYKTLTFFEHARTDARTYTRTCKQLTHPNKNVTAQFSIDTQLDLYSHSHTPQH